MKSYKNQLQEYAQKNQLEMPIYKTTRLPSEDHMPKWSSVVVFIANNGKKYRTKGLFESTKTNAEQNVALKALNHIKKILPSSMFNINTGVFSSPLLSKSNSDVSKSNSDVSKSNSDVSKSNKDVFSLPLLLDSYDEENTIKYPNIPPSLPSNELLNNSNIPNGGHINNKTLIIIDVENVQKALGEILSRISKNKNIEIVGVISTDHYMKNKLNLSDPRVKLIEAPTTRPDGADIGIVMYIGFLLAKEEYKQYFIVSKDHFADAAIDCLNKFDEMSGVVGYQRKGYACKSVTSLISILRGYKS